MARTRDYFKGKSIIITGAACGIGRSTAAIFAREGAAVLCADVDEAGARGAAEAIRAAGGKAAHCRTDVTDRREVQDMIDRGIREFGRVNFLFNSAGSALRRAKFLDIDDDLIGRVMRRFNLPSKRAAVDMALRRLLGEPMTRDEILALQGVGWSGDLDTARRAEAGEMT